MNSAKFRFPILVLVSLAILCHRASGQAIPDGYKLVYQQDFTHPKSLQDFEFSDRSQWHLTSDSARSLECTEKGGYEPVYRSPFTIALMKKKMVGSFILEVDLLQTGREYGHRDMVVVFDFVDDTHFHYTHIATESDDLAHQIMKVDGEPRKKISSWTSKGINWGNHQWRRVRIERDADVGSIKVFFEGELVQEANDKDFPFGAIGFGSFDDSGKIDNIKIWAREAKSIKKKLLPRAK